MDDLEAQLIPPEKKFPQVEEVKVPRNENGEVVILPTDNRVFLIRTRGRTGCDASLLLTIESNGTEHVVVTHYDPEHIEEHLGVIREKSKLHPKGKKVSFLVTFGTEQHEWRQRLEEELTEYQGSKPDIVSLPELGEEQARELLEPGNKLKYQLNFTRGYGGNLNNHRISVPGTDYDKLFATDDLK